MRFHLFSPISRYAAGVMVLVFLLVQNLVFAADSKELAAAKSEYEKNAPAGEEAARVQYVNKLAKMLGKIVGEYRTNGTRHDDVAGAIDAELKKHPMPKNADGKALSRTLVGKWASPRHEYGFHKDGTYVMLPEEPEATRGRWRIEGNQYFDTAASDTKPAQYTLILLNADYFIFADKDDVFFEARMK